MAQLFEIKKVTVGPRTLAAEIELAEGAPERTSEDAEGTQRIMALMPELADHVCLGDAAPHFGEVVEDTELAHLLEHVTVELLARTDIAGDIASGQTSQTGERAFKITLSCPDDVLVTGALSSAVWVLQWAYSGGGDPEPDIDATASGLVDLVASLSEGQAEPEATAESEPVEDASEPEAPADAEGLEEPYEQDVPEAEAQVEDEPEAVPAPEHNLAHDLDEPEDEPEPVEQGQPSAWDTLTDVPRPHLVR